MSGPDATFEDGAERPLRLVAFAPDDLAVISSLVQDAVLPATEMTWDKGARRFALLVNRFRWEDAPRAERGARPYERVQAVLSVEGVEAVRSQGVDRADADTILSVLALEWTPTEAPAGRLTITLAGDGAVACEAEALEVQLRDVTRPYAAPSRAKPDHGA
ncbi:MAG: DUF2948 family protein [Shimia sp.]